jgi:hypothetical protein
LANALDRQPYQRRQEYLLTVRAERPITTSALDLAMATVARPTDIADRMRITVKPAVNLVMEPASPEACNYWSLIQRLEVRATILLLKSLTNAFIEYILSNL